RAVGAELAVVFGLHFARFVFLDVAAGELPFAAQWRETGGDVDRGLRIGIGAGGVVDPDRRLSARGLEVDLAHRHLERPDVDLAAAADRAGGDAYFEMGIDVGHESSPLQWRETVFAWKGRFPPYAGVSRIRFSGSWLQPSLNRSGAVPRGWRAS